MTQNEADVISIVAYQLDWNDQYEKIAVNIRNTVGNGVTRIDHIGSTAVPGLAAKDIIDIQLTLTDLKDERDVSALQSAGYILRPKVTNDLLTGLDSDSIELKKRFFRESAGQRRANIHIREQGRLNQNYPLLFRDYLRSDCIVRDAYDSIKKELAIRFGSDMDAYYIIKDPYMDAVYQAAKLWAQLNDWQPDDKFY